MKIVIDDVWFIDVDDYQYKLGQETQSKETGKNYQKHYGYFGKLEHALERLARILTNEKAEQLSLKEYIEELQNQRQVLANAVKGV